MAMLLWTTRAVVSLNDPFGTLHILEPFIEWWVQPARLIASSLVIG